MKRRVFLTLIIFLISVFAFGCKEENKPNLVREGKFVSLKSTAVGLDEAYKCYTINVDINSDGSGLIYITEIPDKYALEDCPQRAIQLSDEDIKTIKNILEEKDIFDMRQDVGNKDMTSGERKTIITYSDLGEYKTGGLNPSNRDFLAVYNTIFETVREAVSVYTKDIDTKIAMQYNARKSGENLLISDILQYQLFCAKDIERVYVETEEITVKRDPLDKLNIATNGDASRDDGDDEKIITINYLVIKLNDSGRDVLDEYTTYCSEEPEVIKVSYMGTFVFQFDIDYHITDGKIMINEEYINDDVNELAEKFQEVVDYLQEK